MKNHHPIHGYINYSYGPFSIANCDDQRDPKKNTIIGQFSIGFFVCVANITMETHHFLWIVDLPLIHHQLSKICEAQVGQTPKNLAEKVERVFFFEDPAV